MGICGKKQQIPLTLLSALTGLDHAGAFSVRSPIIEQERRRTELHAFATNNYLQGLSELEPKSPRQGSTQAYLESLTRTSIDGAPSSTETKLLDNAANPLQSVLTDEPLTEIVPAAPSNVAPIDTSVSIAIEANMNDLSGKVDDVQVATVQAVNAANEALPASVESVARMETSDGFATDLVVQTDDMLTRIAMAADFVKDKAFGDSASLTAPFEELATALEKWTEESQATLQNGHQELSTVLTTWAKKSQEILEMSGDALATVEKQVVEGTTESVAYVANEMSVKEVADRVAKGLVKLGELVVKVLDIVLEATSGKSLASVAKSTQVAVTEAIAGTVSSIENAANDIGKMAVADVLQNTVGLIATISRVLFRIINGAIEIVSGKNVAEWGQTATKSLEKEASAILESASSVATDLSKKSLYELIVMVGKFELQVAESVMKTASKAIGSIDSNLVDLKVGAKALSMINP